MLSNLETTILQGLINNEQFARKILPYVKDTYFETSTGRSLFQLCSEYFVEYGGCPTREALTIGVEEVDGTTEEEFRSLGETLPLLFEGSAQNYDFLVDKTEEWCKERAVYLALLESISIHDGKDNTKDRDAIPQLLTEALAVCFDPHVGHDYLNDYEERYAFYHLKEEKVPFGLHYLDKVTGGGISNKTLTIGLAGTGVGKSLFMCYLAGSVLLQGRNVLYITMEMAEEKIAERIDANLLNVPIQDIREVPKPMFEDKMKKLTKKTQGKLFIKEYPTASAHAGHFDSLIKELALKKNFTPDIVFIDYLNICASQRYKAGSNVNSYTTVKSIAEELRGLAVKYNVPVVSATQTTRGGYGNSDVELTDTSESFGLPATADLMFALITNDDLESMGQILVKQLKNRYNDHNTHKKFVLGIDRSKMRLYDVEQSAQEDVLDNEPDVRYNENSPKKRFEGFSF